MFRTSPTDCSKLILPDLDSIARETQLVIRQSPKFTPDGFLQTLLSSVTTGLASSNQIADNLKDRVDSGMARQSMHDRFTDKSTAFLLSVLSDLMKQRYDPTRPVLAHGNHHGATAGVKIDFSYDLLSGEVISHVLEQATTQDKVIGKELLIAVKKGDLVLRDMGYFILSEFTAIEELGASWLTRLPLTTGVFLENGNPLEPHLKGCPKDILDLNVKAGEQGKECRLVAMRAAPEVPSPSSSKFTAHGGPLKFNLERGSNP